MFLLIIHGCGTFFIFGFTKRFPGIFICDTLSLWNRTTDASFILTGLPSFSRCFLQQGFAKQNVIFERRFYAQVTDNILYIRYNCCDK